MVELEKHRWLYFSSKKELLLAYIGGRTLGIQTEAENCILIVNISTMNYSHSK